MRASQSGRLQAGRPPLLLHSTGPLPPDRAIGPAGHSIMIGLTQALARAGRPSQEDFMLGGPRCCCIDTLVDLINLLGKPQVLHSHGTGPRPGTGQGHRAGGPFNLYSQRSRSLAGSDSVTEALARTGRPSQKDLKLGGPRCSGCCTVPDRHWTGP